LLRRGWLVILPLKEKRAERPARHPENRTVQSFVCVGGKVLYWLNQPEILHLLSAFVHKKHAPDFVRISKNGNPYLTI